MRTFIAFGLLWAVECASAYDGGTAIAALRDGGAVILAADSLLINDDPGPRYACKIRRSTRFYYAASGLTNKRGIDYDAWKDLEVAARQARTLPEFVQLANTLISPRLANAAGVYIQQNPKEYHSRFGNCALLYVVIATGGGSPEISAQRFMIMGNQLVIEADPDFGQSALTVGSPVTRRPELIDAGPVARARLALETEKKKLPQRVGGAISVMRVQRDGAHWIDAGVCSARRKSGALP